METDWSQVDLPVRLTSTKGIEGPPRIAFSGPTKQQPHKNAMVAALSVVPVTGWSLTPSKQTASGR